MTFYSYRQNNSGGVFTSPAITVVIEAENAEDADRIATGRAGLYFDGVSAGQDCDCCGDRWYRAYEHNASADVPEIGTDRYWSSDKIPAQLVIRAEAKELEK